MSQKPPTQSDVAGAVAPISADEGTVLPARSAWQAALTAATNPSRSLAHDVVSAASSLQWNEGPDAATLANAPCSCHDVAAYILQRTGVISAMKLQKLVYYCQAWSLVWEERPLFGERIRAWANGPVVVELYEHHRGQFTVTDWPLGKPDCLDTAARETIDAVLKFYGDKTPQWLSDLTHSERPWKEARAGLGEGERGFREIRLATMGEYYGSL